MMLHMSADVGSASVRHEEHPGVRKTPGVRKAHTPFARESSARTKDRWPEPKGLQGHKVVEYSLQQSVVSVGAACPSKARLAQRQNRKEKTWADSGRTHAGVTI